MDINKVSDTTQKKQPRVWLATILIVFGVLAVVSGVRGLLDNKSSLITPRGRVLVEVADTDELRQKGLSGRQELPSNQGLLFKFDDSSIDRCFWMKDMNFALDIIWLNADKQVVYIENNVAPDTFPERFCPDEPAQYVLEIKAGRAQELGITEDGIELRF